MSLRDTMPQPRSRVSRRPSFLGRIGGLCVLAVAATVGFALFLTVVHALGWEWSPVMTLVALVCLVIGTRQVAVQRGYLPLR